MKEFFEATFSYVNIIPTGFLVFTLIYWMSVLLGMLDMNFIDFSIDKEVGIDTNAEVSIDKDIDTQLDISWLNAVLSFFNLGKVPFMVFLTFWALPMWFLSVVGNYYLENTSILLSLILLIPNFFISLFISKILTQPLVRIFEKLNSNENDDDFEAKIGIALTNINWKKPGQIQIKNKGVHITVNAVSIKGKEILRDSKIVVVQFLENEKLYLIDELLE